MSIRANWFLEDEVSTGVVTLAPVEERIEDVGVPFDLRDPDSLMLAVTRLIDEESALYNEGVTCAVKDRDDTSCSACAFAHHAEEGHRLQRLCSVGREQERVVTLHAHATIR